MCTFLFQLQHRPWIHTATNGSIGTIENVRMNTNAHTRNAPRLHAIARPHGLLRTARKHTVQLGEGTLGIHTPTQNM